MTDEERDLIEELGADEGSWQWIVVIALLTGALLFALQEMIQSKGEECPKGEICGD